MTENLSTISAMMPVDKCMCVNIFETKRNIKTSLVYFLLVIIVNFLSQSWHLSRNASGTQKFFPNVHFGDEILLSNFFLTCSIWACRSRSSSGLKKRDDFVGRTFFSYTFLSRDCEQRQIFFRVFGIKSKADRTVLKKQHEEEHSSSQDPASPGDTKCARSNCEQQYK